jgi:hypothetical protein
MACGKCRQAKLAKAVAAEKAAQEAAAQAAAQEQQKT